MCPMGLFNAFHTNCPFVPHLLRTVYLLYASFKFLSSLNHLDITPLLDGQQKEFLPFCMEFLHSINSVAMQNLFSLMKPHYSCSLWIMSGVFPKSFRVSIFTLINIVWRVLNVGWERQKSGVIRVYVNVPFS